MIGDMFSEIGSMMWTLLAFVAPYLFGLAGVVIFAAVMSVLWWARPHDETDPVPLIDRGQSDWLGQP